MSNENGLGMMNGGDEYHDGGEGEGKVCRDFMRNVCNRGKNCKFIHPQDIKIRTEPIFCHDFQQNKCFRSTCKFIHCSREEEDHYKTTGELPQGYLSSEISSYGTLLPGRTQAVVSRQNGTVGAVGGGRGRGAAATLSGSRAVWGAAAEGWNDAEDVPVCKDFLKGHCDRPPGSCKFRHLDTQFRASQAPRRRPGAESFYEAGPEAKRSLGLGLGYTTGEYEDYYTTATEYTNPPPPPPQQQPQISYSTQSLTQQHQAASAAVTQGTFGLNEINFGRNGYGQTLMDSAAAGVLPSYAAPPTTSPAMKALEDENFMLKRRIEELKKQVTDLTATNDYLLSQNAHFRLTKDSNTTASVVQTLVSMSQPLGMTMTGPLTTIPTVSMTSASITQPQMPVVSLAQHPASLAQSQNVYPMVTTQGVLPPN